VREGRARVRSRWVTRGAFRWWSHVARSVAQGRPLESASVGHCARRAYHCARSQASLRNTCLERAARLRDGQPRQWVAHDSMANDRWFAGRADGRPMMALTAFLRGSYHQRPNV
jgi:hypothetical protein